MTNIIEIKNLVPINYESREKFFLNENNEVQPLIDEIKLHYQTIAFDGMDGKTEAGRKAIKKLAAELNNKIKEIDDIGKSVTSILKAKPQKIDAGRKTIRDALTEVYNEIRKPVVEYEAEQARIKAEQEAKIAEEVRLEAENKVKEAQREAEQIKREAELKEQQRLAEEKLKADEESRRLADTDHKKRVKFSAYKCLLENGIDKDTAIKVVNLIDDGAIQNIFIIY